MVWMMALFGCIGDAEKDTSPSDTDTPTAGDCETLPGTCGFAATGDTGCPEGFTCWGPSAYVCYRGDDCNLPIRLPPTTRIGTPDGDRRLLDLRPGDVVWTLDRSGSAVPAPILRLEATRAPASHRMVRVDLADGRTVRGSPAHPTADGRTLEVLLAGDVLDGTVVEAVTLVPYTGVRTFDLHPAGPTGTYLADGVWLGSTLH